VTGLLVTMAAPNFAVFIIDSVSATNLNPIGLNLQSQTTDAANSSNLFIVQYASGPQGNMDTAMSTLLSSMQTNGLSFFNTSTNLSGLIGTDDVVIIKVNGQSEQRGCTNTDLAKSLVKTIVGHPDGFKGEIVIADNGQDTGGVDMSENNAYDHSQSMTDVAGMFPDYKVSAYSWHTFATKNVAEYNVGNYDDGYVVNYTSNAETGIKVSYPKFQTNFGTYISFQNGIWNQSDGTYDSSRLKIINLPLFKSHYDYGATACVKNYMGVGSQTLTDMHFSVADGGMGTLMVETRFPTLNIIDGIWINANPFQPGEQPHLIEGPCGPFTSYGDASYTDIIGASTDPVALEYWIAKNVAIPTAIQKGYTYTSSMDPDFEPITQNLDQSYHHYLTASMNEIKKSGRQTTMLESEMNVYVSILNTPTPSPSPSPTPSTTTFGATTVGSLSTTLFTGIPRAAQYTPTDSGTVTDIMLYLTGSGVNGHAQAAIYADSGDIPGALLAKSSSEAITLDGWHDFSGFNVAIVGGTSYWLACETDSADLLWYYNNGGTNYCQGSAGAGFGSFPNPYVRGYFGSYTPSIYAVYTTNSSPTPTPTPSPTPSSSPSPTPTSPPTPTPSSSPSPTPTPTPTPTPNSTPTPTPTPSPSPTPTPTSTPSPSPTPTPTSTPTPSTATFGTTTVGSLSTTLFTGIPRAAQYTPTSSGTVTDIMLYLTSSGTGGHAQVAIYGDNGNTPSTLLAKSSIDIITSNGWHDFKGFNTPITAGTPYWLACESDNSNLQWYYVSGGANYYQGGVGFGFGSFPNPYVIGYFGSYAPSIYAIYTTNK